MEKWMNHHSEFVLEGEGISACLSAHRCLCLCIWVSFVGLCVQAGQSVAVVCWRALLCCCVWCTGITVLLGVSVMCLELVGKSCACNCTCVYGLCGGVCLHV